MIDSLHPKIIYC